MIPEISEYGEYIRFHYPELVFDVNYDIENPKIQYVVKDLNILNKIGSICVYVYGDKFHPHKSRIAHS